MSFSCFFFFGFSGQLGIEAKVPKLKVPTLVTKLPAGTLIRLIACGLSTTVSFIMFFNSGGRIF